MASRSRARRRASGSTDYVSGPWLGARDVLDPGEADPARYLAEAHNCHFPNPAGGGGVKSRPAFTRQATQLGSGSTRFGHSVYSHTGIDGTVYGYLFAGGKMYKTTNAGTSVTDVTPGTVTIASSEGTRVFCATYAGLLIVTDGVNRPWTYDPVSTTATYIQIDSGSTAWSAYGPPAVYGGSLFFLVNVKGGTSYRTAIVWCEPAAPATGYQQTGYANYWELTQSDANVLTCLVGTNSGLYYFRERSIGYITGTVNAALKSTATLPDVSTTIGTTRPATVILIENAIWFLDIRGVVHRLPIGGQPQSMLSQYRRSYDAFEVSGPSAFANAGWNPDLNIYVVAPYTTLGPIRVFDATTATYLGTWRIQAGASVTATIQVTAMGWLGVSGSPPYFVALGSSTTSPLTSDKGWIWQQAQHDDSTSTSDTLAGPVQFITTHPLGRDLAMDKVFTRCIAETLPSGANSHTYKLAYDVNLPFTTGYGTVDQNTGGGELSATHYQDLTLLDYLETREEAGRAVWGLDRSGRFMRVRITFPDPSGTNGPGGVSSLRLSATPMGEDDTLR